MNLANKLTLLRIALVPFFAAFLLIDSVPYNYLWALLIFAAASITDYADGRIAKTRNMITDFGKFLDPLADKILTISAMVCFIELDWIPAWTVIAVIAREFAVSGVRLVAAGGKEKIIIAADFSGKLKTAASMVSIIIILGMQVYLAFAFEKPSPFSSFYDINYYNAFSVILNITHALMYIVAALTVWSGADYIWKYRRIFKEGNK